MYVFWKNSISSIYTFTKLNNWARVHCHASITASIHKMWNILNTTPQAIKMDPCWAIEPHCYWSATVLSIETTVYGGREIPHFTIPCKLENITWLQDGSSEKETLFGKWSVGKQVKKSMDIQKHSNWKEFYSTWQILTCKMYYKGFLPLLLRELSECLNVSSDWGVNIWQCTLNRLLSRLLVAWKASCTESPPAVTFSYDDL